MELRPLTFEQLMRLIDIRGPLGVILPLFEEGSLRTAVEISCEINVPILNLSLGDPASHENIARSLAFIELRSGDRTKELNGRYLTNDLAMYTVEKGYPILYLSRGDFLFRDLPETVRQFSKRHYYPLSLDERNAVLAQERKGEAVRVDLSKMVLTDSGFDAEYFDFSLGREDPDPLTLLDAEQKKVVEFAYGSPDKSMLNLRTNAVASVRVLVPDLNYVKGIGRSGDAIGLLCELSVLPGEKQTGHAIFSVERNYLSINSPVLLRGILKEPPFAGLPEKGAVDYASAYQQVIAN
ncbi:MAG: hypothetical protein AABY26_05170, partial [Nanoarchaeota archaeon]